MHEKDDRSQPASFCTAKYDGARDELGPVKRHHSLARPFSRECARLVARRGEECTYTHCCQGDQVCYHASPNYAKCMGAGTCHGLWPHVSQRTCEVASVVTRCAYQGGVCTLSGCCVDEGFTCFMKHERYGRCMRGCKSGQGDFLDWSCEVHIKLGGDASVQVYHSSDGVSNSVTVTAVLLLAGMLAGGGISLTVYKLNLTERNPRTKLRSGPETLSMELDSVDQ